MELGAPFEHLAGQALGRAQVGPASDVLHSTRAATKWRQRYHPTNPVSTPSFNTFFWHLKNLVSNDRRTGNGDVYDLIFNYCSTEFTPGLIGFSLIFVAAIGWLHEEGRDLVY